jgi:hypothetical protein
MCEPSTAGIGRSNCGGSTSAASMAPWSGRVFADDLPKMLYDGESFNAYTDEFKVNEAAEVRLTHVAVSDAEGNEYTAPYPPIEFEGH